MVRFRQMKTLQKFSFVNAAFSTTHFNQDRHVISREAYTGPTLGRPGRVEDARRTGLASPARTPLSGGKLALD